MCFALETTSRIMCAEDCVVVKVKVLDAASYSDSAEGHRLQTTAAAIPAGG